jgi:hypothetical protein
VTSEVKHFVRYHLAVGAYRRSLCLRFGAWIVPRKEAS